MAVPSLITDLSATAALNSPQGSDPIGNTLDDYLRSIQAIMRAQAGIGAAIAIAGSSLTIPVPGSYFVASAASLVSVTGIAASWDGRIATLKFSDSNVTLVHSASLALPNAANITTQAGDVAVFANESGTSWRCVSYSTPGGGLAAGTVCLFYQASAPLGWTKLTTQNDAALRVVSGSGGAAGGSTAFSTVFTAARAVSGTVDAHVLTTAELPAHNHGVTDTGHTHTITDPGHVHYTGTASYAVGSPGGAFSVGGGTAGASIPTQSSVTSISINSATTGISTQNTGSGTGHTHTVAGVSVNLSVKYCDVILCQKA